MANFIRLPFDVYSNEVFRHSPYRSLKMKEDQEAGSEQPKLEAMESMK